MNEQKSLFLEMAEMIDHHRPRRKTGSEGTEPQPGRLPRTLRWFIPNGGTLLLIAILILTQQVWAKPLQSALNTPGPSATTVNYQGRLADSGGVPLDGNYGMSFSLWDASSGGNLIWEPESHTAVPVSEGLFSVGLGSQTAGGIPTSAWNGDRYLEITVGGETLEPRELIRSVPIAGMALTVPDGAIGTEQIGENSITPSKLALPYGSKCLTQNKTVSIIPGQEVPIPELDLNLDLDNSSKVMVWIDGLANLQALPTGAYANVGLEIDNISITGSHGRESMYFTNLKGQRIIDLGTGSHSIGVVGWGGSAGDITLFGPDASEGIWQVCVYYLVLEQ